ncbi:MAG: ABC transporter permease [Phycisphaerae bacterium]|nr:ABC transporter permease [Phycisphaerae bacterium]
MNTLKFIFKEIAYSRYNFLLSIIAVTAGVGLFVAFFTATRASDRETKKIMLYLGQNLRIISNDTDMDFFYEQGYPDKEMPQQYFADFQNTNIFVYNHVSATLQKKIDWQDSKVIITGTSPEKPTKQKPMPTTYAIEPGTAHVGYQLAQKHQIKKGDTIEIDGLKLKVENTLARAPSEDRDNIRIFMDLTDAQKILNLPGKINEIKALECLCTIETPGGEIVEPEQLARDELKKILPQAQVLLSRGIADIRQKQRDMIIKYANFIMPTLCIVLGICLAVLAMLNVRQRQSEIGILRALGYGSCRISILLLGKFVVIGIVSAVAGFYAGTQTIMYYGPGIFKITAKAIQPDYSLLQTAIYAAVAFSIISAFIPVMLAISTDPAKTLKND